MGITKAICFVLVFFFTGSVTANTSKFSALKGNPELRSASAIVLDSRGNLIYGKDIDTVRPIASITKLMTAMIILDAGLDLEEDIVIANQAAAALGRTYPGGLERFVAAMNNKAANLGMYSSQFADPAGLNADNVSTASDLARMLAAAEGYPMITDATTTLHRDVQPYASRGPLTFNNTNRLLKNANWKIELSKTGYINEAGRCLVMSTNIDGEAVSIVLLNSFGKLTPYGDSNRLRKWMLASSQT